MASVAEDVATAELALAEVPNPNPKPNTNTNPNPNSNLNTNHNGMGVVGRNGRGYAKVGGWVCGRGGADGLWRNMLTLSLTCRGIPMRHEVHM